MNKGFKEIYYKGFYNKLLFRKKNEYFYKTNIFIRRIFLTKDQYFIKYFNPFSPYVSHGNRIVASE